MPAVSLSMFAMLLAIDAANTFDILVDSSAARLYWLSVATVICAASLRLDCVAPASISTPLSDAMLSSALIPPDARSYNASADWLAVKRVVSPASLAASLSCWNTSSVPMTTDCTLAMLCS